MHPAIVESLILAQLGLSGVGLGLLLGVRKPLLLAFFALAGATSIRVVSAFVVWALNAPTLAFEAWLGSSLAIGITGIALSWQYWRSTAIALTLLAAGSLVSLSTKYLFPIGEKEHTDSAEQVALAVVAIGGESPDLSILGGHPKRGIAYALMLSLGPEGRILSSLTPLVFLATIGACLWIAHEFTRSTVPLRFLVFASLAVAAYSLTVPMFRASMFYLNAHTLMGYALLLMMTGVLLTNRAGRFGAEAFALVTVGGLVGVTTRIEGIVLVAITLAILGAQKTWNSPSRKRLFLASVIIGLAFAGWLISIESNVPQELGLPLWLLPVIGIGGATILAAPLLDRFRPFLPLALGVTIVAILLGEVLASGDPLAVALAQWPNLGLGAGGWGTAALVWSCGLILLGWRLQSEEYRRLVVVSLMYIGGILFTKTFDGGFGREGFFDSVNRMVLHAMPVIMTAALIGISQLMNRAMQTQKPSKAAHLALDADPGPTIDDTTPMGASR
jgi:hypothetical protein